MIDWIAPALLSPFLFSIVTLIDKRVLSEFKIPFASFNLFVGGTQGMFGLIILIASPLSGEELLTILKGLSIGMLQGIGLVLMFWLLRREDPSRVVPAMQTSPIFVALLAWPLFGEQLSAIQWLAVVLAVGGGALASVNLGNRAASPLFRPIFLLLIFSAMTMAASQLITKSVTDDLNTTHTVALRGIGLFIVMWTIFARPESIRGLIKFLSNRRQAPWLILAEGAMPFAGHMLIVTAISRGPVSLVAALWGTRPIWVFLGSLVGSKVAPKLIMEEFTRQDLPLKLTSAVMVTIAIVLISTS